MLTRSKRLSPQGNRGIHNKYQVIEEPCEGKLSSTVLEARQGGDSLSLASRQRLDWLNRTKCQIDRCSIVSEPIGEVPQRVDYYTQQSALKETKKLFPGYANIYSEVQQMNLQRLDKAWKRWLVPDKTGERGGRPKFKKRGEKPSFSFSRVNHPKAACFLEGDILRIPKIGSIPIIVHRPIPLCFVLKTATIFLRLMGTMFVFRRKINQFQHPNH